MFKAGGHLSCIANHSLNPPMIINPNNINVKKRPIYDSLRAHNGAQQHIAKMSTQTLAKAPQ